MYANRAQPTPEELIVRFDELELAIGPEGNPAKAEALAMYIARNVRSGPTANLAMQVMSAATELRNGNQRDREALERTLTQLRSALQAS